MGLAEAMGENTNPQVELKGFDDFESSLGDELRGERATLGKSLLDVQRDLRIKAAYISAIENCDPTVFPNQGFIAGYVRSYARYLKIDADEIFERFCQESGFEGVNAGMTQSKRVRSTKPNKNLKGGEVSPRYLEYNSLRRQSVLNTVSPSGIASVLVLALLITGLGFGGWSILKDIQRVDFSPVDQTPKEFDEIAQLRSDFGRDEVSQVSTTISEGNEDLIGSLYRPQELSVPKVEPRDGPIAAINPDEVGALIPTPVPDIRETSLAVSSIELEDLPPSPIVTVSQKTPTVQLYATRAAWVRVHLQDGTVLFEKILETGEAYVVPEDAVDPLLRAGNSGSVYVLVDNQPYGPIGQGTAVAKQVSLSQSSIVENYQYAQDLQIGLEVPTDLRAADAQ